MHNLFIFLPDSFLNYIFSTPDISLGKSEDFFRPFKFHPRNINGHVLRKASHQRAAIILGDGIKETTHGG